MAPKNQVSSEKATVEKIDSNYFRIVPLKWFVLITFGIVYFGLASYFPDVLPYQYLGPLGDFTVYLQTHYMKLLKDGFIILVGIHAFEAAFAVNVCRRLQLSAVSTIMWTVQTFLFGFPSLGIILNYSNKHKKAKSS